MMEDAYWHLRHNLTRKGYADFLKKIAAIERPQLQEDMYTSVIDNILPLKNRPYQKN